MILALSVVLVCLAAVLGYATTKPDISRVERGTRIAARPEVIFDHIDDLHRWTAWSPWEDKDPNLKRSYEGAPRGVGAVYGWEGDRNVGKGRMEIVASTAPSSVRVQLDFLAPFEARSMAEFTLVPEGDATKVVWTMEGPRPYPMKVMSLFLDMDGMIGRDFETGLARLKAVSEA